MDFNELLSRIKSSLKDLTTADNIEKISAIDKDIDSLNEAHTKQGDELKKTKDTLVDYVKNTGFKKPSEDVDPTPKELTLDEAFNEAIKNLKSKD